MDQIDSTEKDPRIGKKVSFYRMVRPYQRATGTIIGFTMHRPYGERAEIKIDDEDAYGHQGTISRFTDPRGFTPSSPKEKVIPQIWDGYFIIEGE